MSIKYACHSEDYGVQSLPAVIIGGTTLAIYCAQQWLRSGQTLSAVVSVDHVFREWAEEQGIYCLDDVAVLEQYCQDHSIAHLFSIVNPHILSPELIEKVKGACFNYHDSPLPRYAGQNATGWALLNQEQDYAVSWHLLVAGVDRGDIVVQIPLAIAADETAFSLNLKCYQAARQGFDQLLASLKQQTLVALPQAVAERSFYAGYRRPPGGGVVRWDNTAAELSALIRALDYGEYYVASLDIPKILLADGTVLLATKLNVLPEPSVQTAGTLLAIGKNELTIATADFDVRISGLKPLEANQPARAEIECDFSQLHIGDILPVITDSQQQCLTEWHENAARHDAFWSQRLLSFSPLALSACMESTGSSGATTSWLYTPWQSWPTADGKDTLLLAFLLVLSRITDRVDLQLGWSKATSASPLTGIMSESVPFHLWMDEERTVAEMLTFLSKEKQRISTLPAYAKTLPWRYPELRSLQPAPTGQCWPILIAEGESEAVAQQLTLHRKPDENSFRLGYNPDSLSGVQIERILSYLDMLGSQLSQDLAQQRCVDLVMLPPSEQDYLINGLNPSLHHRQYQGTLADKISDIARAAPETTALFFDNLQVSYQHYDEQAACWASHLSTCGIKSGDVIAFCTKKKPALFFGILAAWKLGAIYLPLDSDYPAERLALILQDASPTLVLVDENGEKVLSGVLPTGLMMQRLDTQQPGKFAADVLISSDLERLQQTAYIIYTSGSTGIPKGVRVSHANLCSLIDEQGSLLQVNSQSRVLQFASLSFDASIWEMAMAFGYGGALYCPTAHQRLDERALLAFFDTHQITHATLPPALLNQSKELCQGLKGVVLTLAGEAPGIELFHQLSQRNTVINGYGPTEGTVCNVAWRCPENYTGDIAPIGRALGNSKLYLLDVQQRLVPFGSIGELYIGGEAVAQGYLNRSELNAERFIPNPFQPDSAQCLYRTGDLVRYLPDGELLFVGRQDHQVKINGFRIETGDIEAVIKQQGISECTVIVRDSQHHTKRLVAYLVAGDNAEYDINALRQALEKVLPAFMVPAAFVILGSLPLTVNGKIDRKALPEPNHQAFSRELYEAPQGEREHVIATLWAEFLQVKQPGRWDNFFALGGDSLLAMKLIGRLRELGWQTGVEQLFQSPQLHRFASSLQLAQQVTDSASMIPENTSRITPEMLPLLQIDQQSIDAICAQFGADVSNIQDIYPLSPLQEGLYFHHVMAERGDPYLLVTIMAFPERETLQRYLAALQQVIERHDILRTAFIHGPEIAHPVQVVMRRLSLPVTWLELDSHEGDVYAQLRERYDPRHTSLPLDKAPLLQVVAVEDRPNERWLLLHQLHHLVGDHSTLEIIYRELNSLMVQPDITLPSALAFRTLIERTRQNESLLRQREFFSKQLGDITEPCLPYALNPLMTQGESIEELKQIIMPDLNNRLRQQARQRKVSLASIFHLAWARVLSVISGQSQVVFGSVFFGRAYSEGNSQALGMYINTLPARVDVDARAVDAALQHMHQQLAELLAYEQASLITAQQASGIAPPAALFGALLNYRHNSSTAIYTQPLVDFPEVSLIDFNETTSYPLVLSVEDYGDQTGLTLQAVASLSAEQILAYTQLTLTSLVEALEQAPQTPLQQLPVLPATALHALTEQRNLPLRVAPVELCVHQQFEQQAALYPQAIALTYGDQSLSYEQLNQRANQLAHALIQQGVHADSPVALCAVPGLEMMVGLLAILKSGAAYLPIDPTYAVERIRLILDDAQPALVLCDATGERTLQQQGYQAPWLLHDPEVYDLQPQDNPQGRAAPQHLAYIIYTSGSTGTPKGVMIEHRQVSRLFSAVQPWFGFSQQDVWCLFHSFAFDFSVWEIWGALLHGGRLVLVPTEQTRDTAAFYQLLSREGITVLNQTPSAFRSLIAEQRQRPLALALRYVIFGGEALDTALLSGWYESTGESQPQLVNMYGITETTVHVTYRPLTREDSQRSQSPVGQRIPDLKLYLLDAQQQPVPDGVVGELYVAGAGLARGYLNRPELTAERFLADPFSPTS
ncbi:amino acid adenylation domain-containing protein, partial [Xenorhabdus sp. XENO-10]